ncbi:MAG: extracellular solute-binding protein [Clostridia bacterium]|nr:extracellular solute-binding protein [Clostridia bacterium]
MKKLLALALAAMMLLGMMSFAHADGVISITVPHYKTGENVGAIFFLPQVERFNTLYEGKYHIEIEELTQDMYAEKIKQLGQQNKLPALIEGGETEWIKNVVMPNHLFLDLTSFVDENPDLAALLIDTNVAYNTTADGQLFSVALPVVRPMGMYYNGEMLDLGDKTPADMSWDEFLAVLGDNKIAMMTGENAWTTVLVFASLIAAEEGGAELLSTHTVDKIYDFNQPCIVNAVAKLQNILQNYASSNTIGAVYADAANAFMSKQAAVIANGSWMVGDFAEDGGKWSNGFDGSTVRGAVLPGNVALANTDGFGWWIPATASAEEQEVAKAFIAFMMTPAELEAYMLAEGGVAPNLAVSAEYEASAAANPLMYEYVNAVNADTIICPSFGDCVPSSVGDTEFGTLLPNLISGNMTAEQFCQELTIAAEETRLD